MRILILGLSLVVSLFLATAGAQLTMTGVGGGFGGVVVAPIAFVDGITAGSTDQNSFTTPAINSTGANFLVVGASDFVAGGAGTPVDNLGNTWNALTSYTDGSLPRTQFFWSVPTTVGSGHTVTFGTPGSNPSVGFAAFSNVNAAPFDNVVGTSGSSTSPAGGSITPGASNALIVSAISVFGTVVGGSVNSSFIIMSNLIDRVGGAHFGLGVAYLIQGAAATVNPTWTVSSAPWAATNAVFKR